MLVSFIVRWELTSSPLALGVVPTAAIGGQLGLDTAVPWRLGGAGAAVSLEVGPVDANGNDLRGALSLLDVLRDALVAQLPAGAILRSETGISALIPDSVGARAAAPLLAPWLLATDTRSLTVSRVGAELRLMLTHPPVPELGAALLLASAAVLRAVGGPESGPVTIEAAPADSATATLWTRVAAAVMGQIPRRELDTARRWLDLPAPHHEATSAVAAEVSLPRGDSGAGIRVAMFRSGGRTTDELEEPGSGCSEPASFVRSGHPPGPDDDELLVLYRLDGFEEVAPERISVRASAWFLPHEGEPGDPVPVPRLRDVAIHPLRVAEAGLVAGTWRQPGHLVARFRPQHQFYPSGGSESWTWKDAPAALRARVPDGDDPYTFACLFHQNARIELTVCVDGQPRGTASHDVVLYDLDRFGSLYGRLLDLVGRDTAVQARRAGEPDIYPAHHPWYPVLGIGMNKANFYMNGVVEDARRQTRHVGNPWWLLDVGLYLEMLTCIGVFETVRADYPGLLNNAERSAFLELPRFAEIRARINPPRWREIWGLREIVPRGKGVAAGPVSFMNLMKKQAGTLGFLHAHHEDLVHAVDLAGPDVISSQQAWQRVFRDAERAVTNSSLAAFPELLHVPASYRDFALWHEKGDFSRLPGGGLLPSSITAAFGDQDGVYPSGARQYRDSMNHVAKVCRSRGLMDYSGAECVPREVSLIEALLVKDEERFRLLQARDGYGGTLTATSQTVALKKLPGRRTSLELLRTLPLLAGLDGSELEALASEATVHQLVPTQVVVRQGDSADSMYLVESGRMAVSVDGSGGPRTIRTLHPGDVFGEMALLTGAPRAATVTALDYGTVIELTRAGLQPIVQARGEILDAMSELLAARQDELRHAQTETGSTRRRLGQRMREVLLSGSEADTIAADLDPARVEALFGRIPLFGSLTRGERMDLARRTTATRFPKGATVVRQGDRGRSMFIIASGSVTVLFRDGAKTETLATLSTEAVFGEMALLTGERRSADVVTLTDAVIVEIARSDFIPLMTSRPRLVVELSDLLATRRGRTEAKGSRIARRIQNFFFA